MHRRQPEQMWVKPLVGVLRNPFTLRLLSHDEPNRVERNSYWNRRIRCGDVEEVQAPPEKTEE